MAQGWLPTGALFPLNSYENRVYQISLEERDPIVAKFYRPGRWTLPAIAEEHRFVRALAAAEVPLVQPLSLKHPVDLIDSLGQIGVFYYAFFPKFRGREHDEITDEDRKCLGRTLGRLHKVGERFRTEHRLQLNPLTYGYASLEFILRQTFIPPDLRENLEILLSDCLSYVEPFFEEEWEAFPVHGDCHPGNILWNPDGPHLVDFDDMIVAPPVQDLWMLFTGDEAEQRSQKKAFFDEYKIFREFDDASLVLAEPLRTLRMIHHAAWIGQRYEEPAFQRAFPYYRERRYWEEFLLSIKEQISLLQDL